MGVMSNDAHAHDVPSSHLRQRDARARLREVAPVQLPQGWKYWAAGSIACLVLTCVFVTYLAYFRRPPRERPARWRENRNGEHFSPARIGGAVEPLVTPRQAKRLGDMLGFAPTGSVSRLPTPENT